MKNMYRNHIVSDYKYKPLLHKKGKQWITVGLSALSLLGLGGLFNVSANASTNTVKANLNHNLASASNHTQKVNYKPISQVSTAQANKSISNQANSLHNRIVANNAKYQNVSAVSKNSGVAYNALNKVASNNNSKVKANSASASSNSVSSVAPKSITQSSVASQSVANNETTTGRVNLNSSNLSSVSNSASDFSAGGIKIKDSAISKLNANPTVKALANEKTVEDANQIVINEHFVPQVVKYWKGITDWEKGNFEGINYQYSPHKRALELTGGAFPGINSDAVKDSHEPFMYHLMKYMYRIKGIHDVVPTSLKVDSDVDFSNVKKYDNLPFYKHLFAFNYDKSPSPLSLKINYVTLPINKNAFDLEYDGSSTIRSWFGYIPHVLNNVGEVNGMKGAYDRSTGGHIFFYGGTLNWTPQYKTITDPRGNQHKVIANWINLPSRGIIISSDVNTSNITTAPVGLFANAYDIILPYNFGENISDASKMFAGNYYLRSLNIPQGALQNVKDAHDMFADIYYLDSLTLPDGFGKNITNASDMFAGNYYLRSLNIPQGALQNVKDASNMFANNNNLQSLNIPQGALQNVKDASNMFANNNNLHSLTLPDGFGENITNASNMFAGNYTPGNYNLDSLTLPDGFGKNITNASDMFAGNHFLHSLTLPNGFGQNITNANDIFGKKERLQTRRRTITLANPLRTITLANPSVYSSVLSQALTNINSGTNNIAYDNQNNLVVLSNKVPAGTYRLGRGLYVNYHFINALNGQEINNNISRMPNFSQYLGNQFQLIHDDHNLFLEKNVNGTDKVWDVALIDTPGHYSTEETNNTDIFLYPTSIQDFEAIDDPTVDMVKLYNKQKNKYVEDSEGQMQFATLGSKGTKYTVKNSQVKLPYGLTLDGTQTFTRNGSIHTVNVQDNKSDSDTVIFVDKSNNHVVARDTEYGKDGNTYDINGIIPKGRQLSNPSNHTFTFDNGDHIFDLNATTSNDNIPVDDDAVDVNGVITLHFHDGNKTVKDIELPYSGQALANHDINILKNAEVQANTPNDYLNKTIKNFSTTGYKADDNDNNASLYDLTVNPADATYLNGSTKEIRKDIELDYSIDRSKDNSDSNLPGHNATDNINFNYVDQNGNNHSISNISIKGHNGSDANIQPNQIPAGFHIDPEDNNVNPKNNNQITIKNGNNSINVLPNKKTTTISYMNNGKKVGSDTISGNDSSDASKGASDTSININSDNHPNLPSDYNIKGNTNIPFDNGNHNVNVNIDNATDRIVYVASDGTSHGSDKIGGNLNSDIKINKTNEPNLENGYQLENSDNSNNGNIFKDNNQTYTVKVRASQVNPNNNDSKYAVKVNVHKMINGKSDGTQTVTLNESGANNSVIAIHNDDNNIISQLPANYLNGFTATGQDYTRYGKLTTNGITGIPNNTVDFYYSKDSNNANAITVNYNNGDKKISSGKFSKPLNTQGDVQSDVPVPAGYKLAPNANTSYKATDQPQTIDVQVVPKAASELPSDTNRGNIRLNLVFKNNGKWQNEVTQNVDKGASKVGSDFTITAPNENGYSLISNNDLKGTITPSGANPYSFTFVYNANSANATVHFKNDNGADVTPSNGGNVSGNTNGKINFNIPKGYHLPAGANYHFNDNNQIVDVNGNVVPNNDIQVVGDKVVGTAHVHLVYKQSNGQTTNVNAGDAQVVLHGEVGGSQTIKAVNYLKNGYTPNTSDWTINFTPSDVNNSDQDGFSFTPTHTFEYDATTADPVEVAYVDMDDKGNRKAGNLDANGYPVVGHSDLGNFNGIVGQEVRLAKKGTGVDSDGAYYDLNVPAGYHLERTYNPITLSNNPAKAQAQLKALGITDAPTNTGMVLTVALGNNKPSNNVVPNNPIVPNNNNNNKPNKPANNNNKPNNNSNNIPNVVPNVDPTTPTNPSNSNNNVKPNSNNNKPKNNGGIININTPTTPNTPSNKPTNNNNGLIIVPHHHHIKKVHNINSLAHIKSGQTVNYHGVKVVNITNKRTPYYVYNIKNILLHNNVHNIGNTKRYAIKVSKRRGFTGKILRELRINNKPRFLVRWHNHDYFTTARKKFVRNAYVQPYEFKKHAKGNIIKYATIKLRKGAKVYNSIHFNHKTFKRNIKAGSKVKVIGVKNFGQKGYKRTRFVLSNGLILNANKNYVKFVK